MILFFLTSVPSHFEQLTEETILQETQKVYTVTPALCRQIILLEAFITDNPEQFMPISCKHYLKSKSVFAFFMQFQPENIQLQLKVFLCWKWKLFHSRRIFLGMILQHLILIGYNIEKLLFSCAFEYFYLQASYRNVLEYNWSVMMWHVNYFEIFW